MLVIEHSQESKFHHIIDINWWGVSIVMCGRGSTVVDMETPTQVPKWKA